MKKCLLVILCSFFLSFTYGQTFNEKYGQPIVVLIEENPWLMFIGSDVPTFALYKNGQIIYKRIVNKRWKYFEIKNNRETTQKIIKSLGITDSLMKQSAVTDASDATDQPDNIMILNFDTLHQIRVYGDIRKQPQARERTPKNFLKVFDNIINFEDKSATEWLPDTFEVMVSEYSHSPEKPLKWNPKWNDLNSKSTVKRDEESYSIYLDKMYFKDFIRFLNRLKEKQAAEINGKKYGVYYRLPFPNLK